MAWLFSHLWICLTHVYNSKSIFNSTVTRLSWHVLCYLISKNLYSLQNDQPFIFQLICMQLCKCINGFFKPHNKQLNQYCLNFTKKKSFKKRVWVRFGSRVRSRVNLFLLRVKKSGSGRVFFGSGQKILTHFAMSNDNHEWCYVLVKVFMTCKK